MGRIGQAVAERLAPFGVKQFLYSGRTPKPQAEEKLKAKFVPFDTILEESDFVVVTCAYTPDTANLFDRKAFQKMKKSAIFINTSRGGCVVQDDLYDALVNKEIAAAGLDVTTPEPLPTSSPLLKLDNCTVLPHIGSAEKATRADMSVLAAENLLSGLRGEDMACQVNKA